jgi:hypothetical protein
LLNYFIEKMVVGKKCPQLNSHQVAAQAAFDDKSTCHTSWKITRAAKLLCYYPIFYDSSDPEGQCTSTQCPESANDADKATGKCKALNCLYPRPTITRAQIAGTTQNNGVPGVSWRRLDEAAYSAEGPFDNQGNPRTSTAFKVYHYPTTIDADVEIKQIENDNNI